MLFNSYVFLFAFLPVSLLGFYALARLGRQAAAAWLVLVSLFFYGWWNPAFLGLLLVSIAFNYGAGAAIKAAEARPRLQVRLLGLGIAGNLAALIYYKYLFSVLSFLDAHGIVENRFPAVVLPLGISFFTFTQIGYL